MASQTNMFIPNQIMASKISNSGFQMFTTCVTSRFVLKKQMAIPFGKHQHFDMSNCQIPTHSISRYSRSFGLCHHPVVATSVQCKTKHWSNAKFLCTKIIKYCNNANINFGQGNPNHHHNSGCYNEWVPWNRIIKLTANPASLCSQRCPFLINAIVNKHVGGFQIIMYHPWKLMVGGFGW